MPNLDVVKLVNKVVPLGSSSTSIYTCPANHTAVIKLLAFSNKDTSDRTFDLSFTASGGSAQQLLDAFNIAVATNIVYVFDDGKPFFMSAGDALSGVGSSASQVIALVAVEEYYDPNK